MPFIQRRRYYKRTRSVSVIASHTCLQYAMWTTAAALSSQFQSLRGKPYYEAMQKLGQAPDLDASVGNESTQLELAQAWILISIYEFTQVSFRRAWASAGRAIRLVQFIRVNDVDSFPESGGAEDFVVREEKRRTFWMAYCLDRFSCLLEKLPITMREQPLCSRLPCPEHAFQCGTPVVMPFLSQALSSGELSGMTSPFVESIIFTTLWARVFAHQQQGDADRAYGDVSTEFSERQIELNELLSRQTLRYQQHYPAAIVQVDHMLLFTGLITQI